MYICKSVNMSISLPTSLGTIWFKLPGKSICGNWRFSSARSTDLFKQTSEGATHSIVQENCWANIWEIDMPLSSVLDNLETWKGCLTVVFLSKSIFVGPCNIGVGRREWGVWLVGPSSLQWCKMSINEEVDLSTAGDANIPHIWWAWSDQ